MTEQPKIKLLDDSELTQLVCDTINDVAAQHLSDMDISKAIRDECERRAAEKMKDIIRWMCKKHRINLHNWTLDEAFQQYLKEQDGGE